MSDTFATGRPTVDAVAAFPDLAAARRALSAGDWPSVEAFFSQLSNPDDLAYALGTVHNGGGAEQFLRGVAAQVGGPLPRLLLAHCLIKAAWTARTNARAQYVSRRQFAEFRRYLVEAEPILIELTARYPELAPAWTMRLMTSRGLELGKAEAQRRYAECARHEPHHVGAQLQVLQTLCPKWSGSLDEMHAFARRCLDEAPDGSSSGVVVAMAHVEHWLHGLRLTHLAKPEVQQELMAAAQRSVLHPAYRGGYRWVADYNTFAMAFSVGKNRAAAAPLFRALGRFGSELPWSYLGSPLGQFAKHRYVLGA